LTDLEGYSVRKSFQRKKQNQGNEGYEQGNEQGKAEIAQQESA